MSLRADRIKRARRRVDARRAALGNYADRARDDYRRTYSQNLGRTKFRPTKPKVGSAGDVVLNTMREAGGDLKQKTKNLIFDPIQKVGSSVKDAIFPVAQLGMKGLDALMSNIDRSKQNREILGDVYTDDLRKSMMTDDDLKFYNKYMKLGDMRSGQEAQYYYDEANKALQNAQITNRINYALGQPEFGFETTATAGQEPFSGDENIDYSTLADRMIYGTDDSVGLLGTKAGKDFYNAALAAQEDEPGDTLISQYMKNYPTTFNYDPDTFVGTMGSIPSFMLEKDGMVVPPQESDMNYFDPYLSPSLPFYGDNRQKYMNYLFQSGAYD